MSVIFSAGYTTDDQPTTHARIAHSSNWLIGTVTASSTATGYFAEGPSNSLTYEKWRPTALAATWELDFGASQTVDYCCIAGHNMGTQGNSLQVQRYNGGLWTDMIPTTAITSDSPIFCIFTLTADTKYRIRISGGAVPTIAVIRFGDALQMPRAIYGGVTPTDFARQPSFQANISETGEFLGRTKVRKHLNARFAWSNLGSAWVRSNWNTLVKAVEDDPFFIAWRPSEFSETSYCQAVSPPTVVNNGNADLMDGAIEARGYGYD